MNEAEYRIHRACKEALEHFEKKQLDTVYIAYSGGMDSTVLLEAFGTLAASKNIKVVVLHANHGLQKQSNDWQRHCQAYCKQLGLELRTANINIDDEVSAQRGLEAAAREARYRWFSSEACESSMVLVTGHHKDDQTETVLLNLLRGTGIAGLAGMNTESKRNGTILLRPFLEVNRTTIEEYARNGNLKWIEDPSNSSTEFLRNRVRHELLPQIEELRTGARANLVRLANNMRATQDLLEQVAEEDLGTIDVSSNPLDGSFSLPTDKVRTFAEARLINAIRYWLQLVGVQSPARAVLLKIARWCCSELGQQFSYPVTNACFYGYRGRLYYVPDRQEWLKTGKWKDPSKPWLMDGGRQLRIGADNLGAKLSSTLEVVHLSRKDKCFSTSGKPRALGKLVQDYHMPSWRRERLWGVKGAGDILWVAGLPELNTGHEFYLEYSG